MIGFWITNQIVTLDLFHFIGPANTYTCTLYPFTVPLPGLVYWCAFLEQPCKFITETMGPMEGTTWKAWV